MKKVIIILSLFVAGIFSSQAQEGCDTLKWQSLKTDYLGCDGNPVYDPFYRIGALDGATINIDTLPIFYLGYAAVNISNDTFYAGEHLAIISTCLIYTDTGIIASTGWRAFSYPFSYDCYPADTVCKVFDITYDLPPLINGIKENRGIELEEISYWQLIIGVCHTDKDGYYSDSVIFAGADTSIFYVVRGGVGVVETHNYADLQIYPNPVNYELKIMNYEGGNIEVYNVIGQLLYQINKSTNKQINNGISIDVSHLASGMYFLKVDNKVVRFVKE